ncbi:hypothetical protein K5X82_16880 [Halosquirtibacter xylanolyticus]|uniref:hypothetical protein n=1 Tax=Halosquirtibacter xylanolyticus TaxID=3374599 RepID=UPI00374785F8|nr:hypothetical protein K5X82_16880 [Prolixibacteraceae bacterium]
MKQLIYIVAILWMCVGCKNTYMAASSGIDEKASIILITERANKQKYKKGEVLLHIDDKIYTVDKIPEVKYAMKARLFAITQGKHHVVVSFNGNKVYDKEVFIGRNETRKIILR